MVCRSVLENMESISNILMHRRQNPTSKYYDYRLIHDRLQSIIVAREEGDILQLVNLLRSGLVRNLGNISTPRLFNRAFAGTKLRMSRNYPHRLGRTVMV
jgi:hypothetical protein